MDLLVLVVLDFSFLHFTWIMKLTELSMEVSLVFLSSCFGEENQGFNVAPG